MNLVTCSDGETAYELAGPPDGRLCVLVHGFSMPSPIWEPTFQLLAQAGRRVLRYDLYGRGASARPALEYTLELFVRQLSDMLQALEIEQPVDLVGLSMGGPIAAGFCQAHPGRAGRLVLIDPAGMAAWNSPSLALLRLPGVGEWLMNRRGPQLIVDSQAGDFYRPQRFPGYGELARPQMERDGYFQALLSSLRKGPLGDQRELYRQVGLQGRAVLLIWGRHDRTFPVAQADIALALLPGARLELIEEAGHIPHYEQPQVVNPLLVEFLS